MADLFALFDEYAAAYARGERPRAEDYLARAGEGADELARLLDAFVAAAPAPGAAADTAELDAFLAGEPPLLALRTRRGVTRERVADAIVERLRLDPGKRAKVRRCYHRLETGLLEPARVDRRVLDAIAAALSARPDELFPWRARPLAVGGAFLRATREAEPAVERLAEPPEPRDEVDELFGIRSS